MNLNPQLATLDSTLTATYLVFSLQGSLYAVDTLAVREILWLPELTPLEEMPSYIVGVVNLRGKIVPVMDLSLRLGRSPHRYSLDDSVIILEWEAHTVGIIVNQVQNVCNLTAQEIQSTTTSHICNGSHGLAKSNGQVSSRALTGIARVGEEIIMLLNLSSLLQMPDAVEAIETAGALEQITTSRYFCPQATPEEKAIFRDRARSLMESIATQDYAGLLPVAVVVLNEEYFGIDLGLVREFSHVRQITPVPCCPAYIVGQMNLRGDILTLVDIRASLQMPLADTLTGRQVMVVQVDNLIAGVLVDDVLDVVYLRPADIKPVPSAVQALSEDYLRGTAPHGEKMLGLLDLAKILTRADMVVYEEV